MTTLIHDNIPSDQITIHHFEHVTFTPLTDEELTQITDREDILDNLRMGGAPADWLTISTRAAGYSVETALWAVKHARARTEEFLAPGEVIDHVLEMLIDIKAESIANAADEIEELIDDANFRLVTVNYTDEVVTVVLDGHGRRDLDDITEAVEEVLTHNYAGHLEVEVVMIAR